MKLLIGLALILSTSSVNAQKKNVKYKYKQYEKFDFESIDISGDKSSPGDLSISNRFRKEFKNKIPSKPNFVPEMKASIDAVL